MQLASYLTALCLVLAGPTSVVSQRQHQGNGPGEYVITTVLVHTEAVTPTTQVVANPSSVVEQEDYHDSGHRTTTINAPNSPPASSAPVPSGTGSPGLGGGGSSGNSCSGCNTAGGDWCLSFTGIPFYWTEANPWGEASGSSDEQNQWCVSENSIGGAIYFGTQPNPGKGDTKFECTFDGSDFQNCDVSLVDGYSVSIGCTAKTATEGTKQIGNADLDLWSQTGDLACPQVTKDYCTNPNGPYATSEADGIPAFYNAAQNIYYTWTHDDGVIVPVGTGGGSIDCTVKNGIPSNLKWKRDGELQASTAENSMGARGLDIDDNTNNSNAKRGDGEAPLVVLKDVLEPRGLEDLGVSRRHRHRARSHARGLRGIVKS